MKYKKILGILGILSSYNLLALEGYIKTGVELETKFSPRVEDEANNIDAAKFRYEKLSYNLKLFDGEISLKDYGLKLGTTIKSSRENSKLNDWDNDIKNIYKDDRTKNHDFMAKFYVSHEKDIYDLKLNTDLVYYLDDLASNRYLNEKTGEIVDLDRKAEYVEEDGKKEALGNFKLDTKLKGKIGENDINLGFGYKANQFDRFDKDESYLKTNVELKSKLFEGLNLELAHNFNYDLYFSNNKFNPFTTDLDTFPDFMGGNYVDKIDQDAKFELKYEEKAETLQEYGLLGNLKVNTFLVGGENKTNKITTVYNEYEPNVSIYFNKAFDKELKLKTSLNNDFKFRHTIYYPQNETRELITDLWASYKPGIKFDLAFDREYGENKKLSTNTYLGYKSILTIAPFVTNGEYIGHETEIGNKSKYEYEFSKENNLVINSDINFKLEIQNKTLNPSTGNLNFDITWKDKLYEKLNLEAKLENKLTVKTEKRTLNADNFKEEIKASLSSEYQINDNLKLKNNLSLENETVINYHLMNKIIEIGEYTLNGKEMPKTEARLLYNGRFIPLTILNRIVLNNNLTYEKDIDDKLKLNFDLALNGEIEAFALRHEKQYHYNNRSEKLTSDKELLKISDYRETKWNIGAKLELDPTLSLEYKLKENLLFKTKFGAKLEFSRNVRNIIKDKIRPDDGLYGAMDKQFGFKKLVPSIALNLEYKW